MTRYYHPDEFAELKRIAMGLGFVHVEAGPLVRSSYHAHEQADAAQAALARRLTLTPRSRSCPGSRRAETERSVSRNGGSKPAGHSLDRDSAPDRSDSSADRQSHLLDIASSPHQTLYFLFGL